MRKIYIILTHTGTLLSNIIKFYMGCEFSHVSIALDEQLEQMYSFGRLHPYNPFLGGFVHEYIKQGTFKRFQNTTAKVYCLPHHLMKDGYMRLRFPKRYSSRMSHLCVIILFL